MANAQEVKSLPIRYSENFRQSTLLVSCSTSSASVQFGTSARMNALIRRSLARSNLTNTWVRSDSSFDCPLSSDIVPYPTRRAGCLDFTDKTRLTLKEECGLP